MGQAIVAEGTTLAPWGNLGRRASRHNDDDDYDDDDDDGHDDHDDEGPTGMMVMMMKRGMFEKKGNLGPNKLFIQHF